MHHAAGADMHWLTFVLHLQVHRLNPEAYEADCQRAIQQVIRPNGRQAFKFSDGKDSQCRFDLKHTHFLKQPVRYKLAFTHRALQIC